MHGRLCEQRHQSLHMWPVPATTTVAADPAHVSLDFFSKDGRKIHIGDCALFKPPQDSPPFIGIIRRLTVSKDEGLKLGVNWLYRPADIKLGKGNLLEAAPNEIFYSFHKDEIPAASLLHPCKITFLRKGVELPSGISSFVCRRVYDIESKCLWWLTDQDYINERQEEVDKLLDKTKQEMHGATQPGGRSPKPLNGPTSTSTSTPHPKPDTDIVQHSSSPVHSQVKGKKKERSDQTSDLVRREHFYKTDDVDSGQFIPENMLKSEIAKITEEGGLINLEGVEKLVRLMQPDSAEKKIDLAGRIMLVDVIAVTDKFDCLGRFVQLRGLPVLDGWLQEAHKGKIGDGSSPKESDKSVEEFLFVLLRALEKLPINLDALQTCNVGKSVNNLRGHKNSEIQKKSRSLVDTWKKRVEAEMNMIDAKSGSSRNVSWPSKPAASEICNVGSRRPGGSSEVGAKSSIMQPSASKATLVKAGSGDIIGKFSPVASPGPTKSPASMTTSVASNSKESNSKINIAGGTMDQPLATIKEEKRSSSSQSQNNSQSCSSDHVRTVGSSCREDARSSTAVSGSINKVPGNVSRHRKSSNSLSSPTTSGAQKEIGVGKFSSPSRNMASEKGSPTGLLDMPLDQVNDQRLIVRLPNSGRSPARSASGGSFEDPAGTVCRSSPPSYPERNNYHDRKLKGKNDALQGGLASSMNVDSCQGKDVLAGSDEANGPATSERNQIGEGCEKSTEVLRTTVSSLGTKRKAGKSYDDSFSSINALADSCVKFSEASASASVGDELGMNLLASVAAGEISKSEIVSPLGSPRRNSPVLDSSSGSDAKVKQWDENVARSQGRLGDGANCVSTNHGFTADPTHVKNEQQNCSIPLPDNFSGDSKVSPFSYEEKAGENGSQLNSSGVDLQQNRDTLHPASDEKFQNDTKEGDRKDEGNNYLNEQRNDIAGRAGSGSVFDSKSKARSPSSDCVDGKLVTKFEAVASEAAGTSAKGGKVANEDSRSCSSSEVDGKDEKSAHNESASGVLVDQKPPPTVKIYTDSERNRESTTVISRGHFVGIDSRADKADETKAGNSVEQSQKQKMEPVASNLDQSSECPEKNLQKKEASGNCLGGIVNHDDSSAMPPQKTEDCADSGGSKLPRNVAGGVEEHALCINTSATGSDTALKLDFDLNEGFPGDDGNQGDPKSPIPGNQSSVHLLCPLPFPMSSMSGTVASITFAAAAKGPFVPPENLLRGKGELGWKGSAATSAFRPAEPRKILEMTLSSTDVSLNETSSCKRDRPHLDIDLNVPDQRVLEDLLPQKSARITSSKPEPHCHGAGGLDLDLNRADDNPDLGHYIVSNGCRPGISSLAGRSSLSSRVSNGEVNFSTLSRGFDLNNGPGPDEMGTEIASRGHHVKHNVPFPSSVSGLRLNSSELGNFSSWFPPGNSYSAITIPSILPGRVEQSYPDFAAGSQRGVLGPSTSGSTLGPETYRGPVLSSSPAMGFPSSTPFQYPGFPFETSFPLASNSFPPPSSAYMDSSSGGGLCLPAIPSQMVGPVGASHYSRPYVVSLQGATGNVGPESRKWGSQILDLNAGPGMTDVERRDERVMSALRQLPVASSQAMIDEQLKMFQAAGGLLKRKEPDGGWDADRGGYKQPSWK